MTYLKSLGELVLVTFLFSFLGLLTADGFDLLNVSALKAAAVSSLPSVAAVLYGAVARWKGDLNSALVVDTRNL